MPRADRRDAGLGASRVAARRSGCMSVQGVPTADSRGAGTERTLTGSGGAVLTVPGCPDGMALVEAEYCPTVRQVCLSWMEEPSLGGDGRCARFAPSECLAPRVAERFCIDRDEYARVGESLPTSFASWSERASGTSPARARRCSRTRRASSATTCAATSTGWTCSTRAGTPAICACHRRRSRDASVPSACGASSAMWTSGSCGTSRRDRGAPRSKGGWWLAGRNRCRPATTAHDEHYCDFQTGFRCCAEAQAARQIAERPA